MPKTSTIAGIAVGTVVAAGLAVGAYMLMSKKSSKAGKGSKKRGKRAGGGGKRGGVSLEVLLQMFDEIIAQMKVVKQKLDQIKLQIKRDAAAKGQQVNDAEIDGMIAQQFAEAMKSIEAKIYERHGVKQAEVEKATETHSADGKYEAKVKELQELFNSIHPQEAAAGVQLPAAAQADIEAITMDVVVKAVEDSMAAVNNFVRTDLVERIKGEMGPDVAVQDPRFQRRFFEVYQIEAPKKQEAVLRGPFGDIADRFNCSATDVFQAAIAKWQHDAQYVFSTRVSSSVSLSVSLGVS
jgi:hypothetical protein